MLSALKTSLLLKPALLALMLLAPSAAIAAESQVETVSPDAVASDRIEPAAEPVLTAEADLDITSLDEIGSSDDVGQVTSVSQLSDVQPTDWAFQALQSLVERYGCIAGYPNGTFRGNRSATRYEMAAALNACLDQISDSLCIQSRS